MEEKLIEIEIDMELLEEFEDMAMFGTNGNGKKCCNDSSKDTITMQ